VKKTTTPRKKPTTAPSQASQSSVLGNGSAAVPN